jgi:hypothetical protein
MRTAIPLCSPVSTQLAYQSQRKPRKEHSKQFKPSMGQNTDFYTGPSSMETTPARELYKTKSDEATSATRNAAQAAAKAGDSRMAAAKYSAEAASENTSTIPLTTEPYTPSASVRAENARLDAAEKTNEASSAARIAAENTADALSNRVTATKDSAKDAAATIYETTQDKAESVKQSGAETVEAADKSTKSALAHMAESVQTAAQAVKDKVVGTGTDALSGTTTTTMAASTPVGDMSAPSASAPVSAPESQETMMQQAKQTSSKMASSAYNTTAKAAGAVVERVRNSVGNLGLKDESKMSKDPADVAAEKKEQASKSAPEATEGAKQAASGATGSVKADAISAKQTAEHYADEQKECVRNKFDEASKTLNCKAENTNNSVWAAVASGADFVQNTAEATKQRADEGRTGTDKPTVHDSGPVKNPADIVYEKVAAGIENTTEGRKESNISADECTTMSNERVTGARVTGAKEQSNNSPTAYETAKNALNNAVEATRKSVGITSWSMAGESREQDECAKRSNL